MIDRNEANKLFRKVLKEKTGKAWSVKGDRGTAWGWITITAPKSRRVNHEENPAYITHHATPDIPAYFEADPPKGEEGWYISDAEAEELALAFNMLHDVRMFRGQGLSINPDSREFYLDMVQDKLHRCPHCKNSWISKERENCTDCTDYVNRPAAPPPLWLQPTVPTESPEAYTKDGKVKALKFEITNTEYASLPNDKPLFFYTWQELHDQTNIIAEHHAVVHGVKELNCYDKTWVTIHYADGQTYSARLDIHAMEDRDMGTHMLEWIGYHTGDFQPAHLSAEEYAERFNSFDQATIEEFKKFVETYEIKAIPSPPIDVESILEDIKDDDTPEPPPPAAPQAPPQETAPINKKFLIKAQHNLTQEITTVETTLHKLRGAIIRLQAYDCHTIVRVSAI